jgi:hypothetical protein
MAADRTRFWPRITRLADRARADHEAFEPPADTPAEERALEYLREGAGQAVAVYVEARTADDPIRFTAEEHRLLERAMNDWLELYARCYGVEIDAQFAVREAAELLVDTHNIRDVAQLLTDVPARR